jgi:hypothetical protein
MKLVLAAALVLSVSGCVAEQAGDDFEFGQGRPMKSGKSDAAACGSAGDVCEPALCDFDCSNAGQQCMPACANEGDAASTGVRGEVSGYTLFDSSRNPYLPVVSTDNVLVYGCNLWDYTDETYDGLEVTYTELIHAPLVVDASDPRRTQHDFGLYIDDFRGPGSYRAAGHYAASHDTTKFEAKDACSLDVGSDGAGGIFGEFRCEIVAENNAAPPVTVNGSFSCPRGALNLPIFSRWAEAPTP